MFSYRHAFHAGNHADVLKHLTLLATLRHLMRKPTPLLLVDTHAGAGIYRLDSDAAQTSGEAGEGIARLQATPAPSDHRLKTALAPASSAQGAMQNEALADYLEVVARFNPAARGAWRVYPGSPLLMHALMTEPDRAAVHDRLKLFELHPTDAQALRAHIDQLDAGRQVTMTRQDGLAGLKALLPPPPAAGGSRRALVLIDPSYEIKSDYAKVAEAVQDALKRFATGVYLVWYPIIPRPEAHGLPRRLRTLTQQAGRAWLDATLHIGAAADGGGLTASGMFVINPPHTLKAVLDDALPPVLNTLRESRGRGAAWSVEAGAARA
ncbi:23S rRNA (adenine(2030)-N(6))-methyltransferase RlmJ [Ottowia sp.]|mgnify:FL=1|uniref:23S rRNA (adenine(2030)-N(6))-methyltransferase RlmJ n=1 Tax=Ottowia sp. TaxID=1898956 RepID=UPI002BACDCF3|nr:23S rRNA (adenine(2030)-N(6))-methyltransferase RlmJ [Ottowia sp.]HOB66136.1 23S rRNA (adenine(2030)-N(6))-methyltransferase RlmJ [Ottowia sp.]HPZ57147.1 23S rRNA (adenine(2030)-N(6))-methyltransferase RlmJ [Ottowia sp.]HQD47149.1 23S rRNA (adenine(2030)-N(6))-methyltransferase RlmJ [Ottowia sp.]